MHDLELLNMYMVLSQHVFISVTEQYSLNTFFPKDK